MRWIGCRLIDCCWMSAVVFISALLTLLAGG